jgi:hypothetical protein
MCGGIKPAEALETQHGREKQRLKAATSRLLAVMPQGHVIVWMPVLRGLDGLLELGHHRRKGVLWVEPMGTPRPPHKRHMGHDPHDLCALGNCQTALRVPRTALATIHPPCGPPPIDMAKAHSHGSLPLGSLVEEHATRARWLLLEPAPQPSLLNFTALSSRTQRWTRNRSEVPLREGEWHGFILREQDFRMKSVHALLQGNAHFYPQQN